MAFAIACPCAGPSSSVRSINRSSVPCKSSMRSLFSLVDILGEDRAPPVECQGEPPPMKKRPSPGGRRSGKRNRDLLALYEDDAVVALDKPAGLPAVPVKGSDAPSAWSLLSAE